MTREEAINTIKSECYVFNPLNFDRSTRINTALDIAIKALEQEPSVNETLDKIRAEIEKFDYLTIEDGSDGYDHYVDKYDVLKIVDKYRVESEVSK